MVGHNRCRTFFCLTSFLLILPQIGRCEENEDAVTAERVFRVWKQRLAAVRSVHFEWQEDVLYEPGSMLSLDGTLQPPKPARTRLKRLLIIDGDKMRMSYRGREWHSDTKSFVPTHYIATWDGKSCRLLFDYLVGDDFDPVYHSVGFDMVTPYFEELTNAHLAPILYTYRPFYKEMYTFARLEDWQMTRKVGVVAGSKCLLMTKRDPRGIVYDCWVDPEMEFAIRRIDLEQHGYLWTRLDIDYQKSSEGIPVPTEWRIIMNFPESTKLDTSAVARVTSWKLNPAVDASAFACDFGPGTKVIDEQTKSTYIVLRDGSKRVMTEAERNRGATYEELIGTKSGGAGLPRTVHWSGVLAAVLVGLAVVLCALAGRMILRSRQGS